MWDEPARRLILTILMVFIVGCEGGVAGLGSEAPGEGGVGSPNIARPYASWPMPSPPSLSLPFPAKFRVNSASSTDLVTELIWQHAYSEKLTWQGAMNFCVELRLDDHDDWRLPHRVELVSIVDYRQHPSISSLGFPAGTPNDYFWTSSERGENDEFANSVYFGASFVTRATKTSPSAHARCVRGGSEGQTYRYQVGNLTVVDENTRLEWQRNVVDGLQSWAGAQIACEDLKWNMKSDWRMPTMNEMQTIVDEEFEAPAVDPQIFPETPNQRFWTGSAVVQGSIEDYLYLETDGTTNRDGPLREYHYRCVRLY